MEQTKQSMPKELKEKWVADLRANPSLQGQGALKDNLGRFCCLGRLQVVAEGEVERDSYNLPRQYPSDSWMKRHGIVSPGMSHDFYLPSLGSRKYGMPWKCSTANDEGQKSFAEIADAIEKDIEGI